MIEVTREMIETFNQAIIENGRALPLPDEDVRAGLEAVFRLIDNPIPESVTTVLDDDGDTWEQIPDRPGMWRLTAFEGEPVQWIVLEISGKALADEYGPLRWEGKA